MKNKFIFGISYSFLLAIGFYTVYKNIPFGSIVFTSAYMANIAQRVFGLTLFTMLSVQIVLGAFMPRLTEKFGGWIYSFHIFHGVTIYILTLLHALAFLTFNYFAGRGLDPFYVFVDYCLFCKSAQEYYLTLGRFALLFLTIAVTAGLFRSASVFLRVHWRKFHLLNYFVFILMALHAYFLGTDTLTSPFVYLYWGFNAGFVVLLLYKIKVLIQHRRQLQA